MANSEEEHIKGRIENLLKEGRIAALLVSAILYLFFQSL